MAAPRALIGDGLFRARPPMPSRPTTRRTLFRRLAVSAAIAVAAALWSVYDVGLLPPELTRRHVEIGAASAHVLVDAEDSYVLDEHAGITDFTSLTRRAALYGELLTSAAVRREIAERMGIPAEKIVAKPRLTGDLPAGLRDPDSEHGAEQVRTSGLAHRLDVQPDAQRPVLHVYAQAPSAAAAVELADAAVAELLEHLDDRARGSAFRPGRRAVVTPLGPARGSVVNAGIAPQIVVLTLLVAFAAAFTATTALAAVRRGWSGDRGAGAPATPGSVPPADPGVDCWPHTSRLLPWAIAAFMAIVWLFPFNTIELTASLPFDLKLDRIVLPFVVGLWLLSQAAGGRNAPRVRSTPIHVAVAALGLVVALGVVAGAASLNQQLELELGIKKLSLLLSYGVLFVVVSSSVRAAEVPAFMRYTLALALLVALGTVWEGRMGYNVFYDVSDLLLPPFFMVGQAEAGLFDAGGRQLTRGPGEHPLEIVAMFTMALPIALAGMVDSSGRRATALYGLATCLLLAAALSTDRKSALLAPLAVCAMFAYYRRAQFVKLAPFGAVLVVGIQLLSPGAIHSVLRQLSPEQLGVGTVSDRASDYDAVRPDIWSHLLLGRGYGTYDRISHRLLDSEMLNRLIDTGLLGTAALLGVLLTIIAVATGPIRRRDPVQGPIALVAAPAALAYLVLAFLFDVGSFPHAPYILMCIAGLLAVSVVAGRSEPQPPRHAPEPRRIVLAPPGRVEAEPDRLAIR